ncbi:SulP family inorganic anion transporter [Reichenbachiella versicolor]|uniref:SulP family inorganic anion transporter n=1 Tax=Reichenbachiella versicolor TaxID=1821036 RepID=UPI000D6E8638|nr:SulP family inorganic anion transporter [Reichenbachiella versicolor]
MDVNDKTGLFDNLKYDIPASLVVFLVALPLCLGIALASGAPLFSGIIAGVIGGIIVGSISGSSLGVSGPAAGLAAIVLSAIEDLGSFDIFILAVVIAGAFQVLLGILKAGVIGYYFPNAVIKGMLSGIGIIIILKQIPHALGYDKDPEGDMSFIQPDGHTTFSELAYMLDSVTPGVMIVTAICMTILIIWEQPFIKKLSFAKLIPGPLVAVIAGVVLEWFFDGIPSLDITEEHLVSIPVAKSVPKFLDQFTTPDFSQLGNLHLYVVAFTIAVVASLETLLSVEATDKLDPEKRVTPTNQELIAQGCGNIVSGLIGGLPITQVIVRSSANIQIGAKSKLSAIVHGVLLMGCAIIIPHILNMIPLASLATVLLVIGYKLAKPSIFKEIYNKGLSQLIPYLITIIGIVFTDLLTGIGLGMIIAFVQILWINFKTPYHYDPDSQKSGEPIHIQLSENVSFLNKAGILNTLNLFKSGSHVIIDTTKTKTIHPDVIEMLDDFKNLQAPKRNIQVEIPGLDRLHQKGSLDSLSDLVIKN